MRISTKTLSLMAGSLFVLGVAAGGCGSSSSSGTSLTATCNQYCAKCNNASAGIATVALCANCSAFSSSMSSCTNESQIASAAQACANMSTCSASETCFENNIPECQSGGATGGSSGTSTGGSSGAGTGGASGAGTGGHTGSGTGGSTGAAGSGGTADCSICDKANTCCMAEASMFNGSASDCTFSNATCTASGSSSATYAMGCQQVLTVGQALSLSACQ